MSQQSVRQAARRLSVVGLAALHRAVNDPATVERFR
jgi:uncharacterized membrane protein